MRRLIYQVFSDRGHERQRRLFKVYRLAFRIEPWRRLLRIPELAFEMMRVLPLTPRRKSILRPPTLKNAASLVLIGMFLLILLTILVAADFINTVLGLVRGLIPSMALLRSLIYLVAGLTVAVFFYVFNIERNLDERRRQESLVTVRLGDVLR